MWTVRRHRDRCYATDVHVLIRLYLVAGVGRSLRNIVPQFPKRNSGSRRGACDMFRRLELRSMEPATLGRVPRLDVHCRFGGSLAANGGRQLLDVRY